MPIPFDRAAASYIKMPRTISIRWATALALCSGPCLPAQLSTLPHGKPSAAVPYSPPATSPTETQTPAAPPTPAQRPARRAEVTFTQGQLAIVADNASLNQILREIGRTTGIKISGGVAEERVFGKYGPSPTQDVLTALLDGTSSNLLLVQGEPGKPSELILTPRHGGPTPPNPNAPGFDDGGDVEDQPQPQPQRVVQPPPSQPQSQAAPATGSAPPASTGAQPTSPTTDATDPNAVKTPQQIYEQLQRMRQQQTPPPQ